MSTLPAKKLNDALAKAKGIGLVEETFTVGGCEVTLRSLRPDEYADVLKACEGFDEIEYLHAYYKEHVARAIVGLNGMDLHGVEYVEVEKPDPDNPEKTRVVKVELHSYLLENVVDTWGKEAVFTAYRKFSDVVEIAERKAKEGVKFLLPEETDEDRYRRLLLEAKEAEASLPDSLIDTVLEEHGWIRMSTAKEAKAAMERADKIAREEAAKEAEADVQKGLRNLDHLETPPEPKATEPAKTTPEPSQAAAPRQPMNQAPGQKASTDPHATLQQAIEMRRKAPVQSQQEERKEDTPASRAAQIAALEAEAGIGVDEGVPPDGQIPVHQPDGPLEVPELRKQERVDPKKAVSILDTPPAAGINPRFKPPTRV